jgi:hypothetical protein
LSTSSLLRIGTLGLPSSDLRVTNK